jgi:ABC-2 type transport system ATP-binding protein
MLKEIRSLLRFEVHVVEHCNLNCRGCFHCSPLADIDFLDIKEYARDLQRLQDLFGSEMEYISLLGGEPLLHPEINDFFEVSRKFFPKGTINLVTNGILLKNMDNQFWQSMKKNKITLRPTEYPISVDYNLIKAIAEKYNVKYKAFDMVVDESGKKLLEHYHFDIYGKQSASDNFSNCYRGNFCIFLRHGKLFSCVLGANIAHLKRYFNLSHIDISDDGIDIYKCKNKDEIMKFLAMPMKACRYCNLNEKKEFLSFTKTKYQLDEWI